jgi:nitrate reductase NapD
MAGVEVHAVSAEGRLIVSIEAASDRETADTFVAIQELAGVLSASLVYCHFEAEPDSELIGG